MEPLPYTARHFHPLIAERHLGRGPTRLTLDGRDYALFRDGSGRPGAILDQCPHRRAPLHRGRVGGDGRLHCSYHGWSFDRDGHGRSPTQPTLERCDTQALRIERRFGYLWGCETSATARFPLDVGSEFHFAGAFRQRIAAPLPLCLDNLGEDEHRPWLHRVLGWERSRVGEVEFSADYFDDRSELHYRAPQRPSRLLSLFGVTPADHFVSNTVTRFDPVRSDCTMTWQGADGAVRPIAHRLVAFLSPENAHATRMDVFTFVRITDERLLRWATLVGWSARALGWLEAWDDRRLLESLGTVPISLDGLRLGKLDRPLLHHRRLLDRLYFGLASGEARLSVVH